MNGRNQFEPIPKRWLRLRDHLSDRHQVVVVEGELSSKLPVIFGVPQGSVGPLLFIVYTNNIVTTISSGSEINRMFTDDIALY